MNIGFIGLGKMGQAIVGRLLSGGHRVRVWNRSPEPIEALVAQGAEAATSPADLVGTEVLLSMLANDAAVQSVIVDQGVLDAAPAGLLHLNLATVSVSCAQALSAEHRLRNLGYLAAPVFGRPDAAAAGKLNVVVAGDPALIARAEPVLSSIAQKTWPVGDRPESANAVKIAGNFMIASAIETMGEAVALAAADAHCVPMPFANILRDNLMELAATGGADQDWGALAQLAARRAGLDRGA